MVIVLIIPMIVMVPISGAPIYAAGETAAETNSNQNGRQDQFQFRSMFHVLLAYMDINLKHRPLFLKFWLK